MKTCFVITAEDAAFIINGQLLCDIFKGHTNETVTRSMESISENGFFAERKVMEKRPEFKQIIPTFVLRDKKSKDILLYQRKATHTESRLANLWTCAFGGHIDPSDTDNEMSLSKEIPVQCVAGSKKYNLPSIIKEGLRREMEEETGINIFKVHWEDINFKMFIYDDSNEVGKVHLGVCFVVAVDFCSSMMQEIINKPEIATIQELKAENINESFDYINYESWAKIILTKLNEETDD